VSQDAFEQAQASFAQPLEEKLQLSVTKGGIAWRGYMPRGGEFTKGNEDQKEGLCVGPEHTETHPRWGTPLYGRNLFPDAALPRVRPAVLRYIREVDALGHRLMGLLSLSLGLGDGYLARHVTGDALNIVRLFNYPHAVAGADHAGAQSGAIAASGIEGHTDYGLWTMLQQDAPGLEYEHPIHGWQPVPFLARSVSLSSRAAGRDAAGEEPGIVCAAGDILDRMTERPVQEPAAPGAQPVDERAPPHDPLLF
jgi:isopenicillin N synthase-like dioxygenase